MKLKRCDGIEGPELSDLEKAERARLVLPYGGQEKHLLHGYATGDGREYQTIEDYRAAWEQFRDVLLSNWIKHRPCTRPAAWYILECSFLDELPQTDREPLPTHFGRPLPDRANEAIFLELHGVLTPDELATLETEEAA